MNELLNLALDQQKIRGILNVIFVGSIASCVFELLFFKYSVIEISDYKSIYSFFISGHFIVSFALFYFLWILTIGLKMLFFDVPNVFITKKFGPRIRSFLIWYYTDNSKYSSKSALPESKSLDWLIKSSSEADVEESRLKKRTIQSHRSLESDYTLILRAFIAITIYFNSIEYFGWITYSICILILLFMWLLQILKYQLAEAAPHIIRSNQEAVDKNTSG